jgi:hypothetical protein
VATLDERAAFQAMRRFLRNYYERGDRSVGDLLGDIDTDSDFWGDGSPVDPAQWNDWLQAIKETTAR